VRRALGAKTSAVLSMVVGAGLRFVLAGVLVGMAASLVLVRLIEAQLADVAAHDPVRLAGTAMLLTMTAGIACWS
jgi:putative ABC transport system permease protein